MKKLIYIVPYVGFKSYIRSLPDTLSSRDKFYYDIISIYNGAVIGSLVGLPVFLIVTYMLNGL